MNIFAAVTMWFSHIMSVLFPSSFAVDPTCNYYQTMTPGVTYYVYNNGYPGNYGPGQNCRWIAIAPSNSKIQVDCQVELPQSVGCYMDKLLISYNGDPNLNNADSYCGYGNITDKQSTYNNISIGLISSPRSSGGRFLCTITTSKPVCDCGWKNTRRIVGGVETKVNEFPMMCGLIDFMVSDLYCGATIISVKYALTAAHCLRNMQATAIGLLVGDHNISSGLDSPSAKIYLIDRFLIHPSYNPSDPNQLNDIAVVETSQNILFSMQVGPACLPFRYYSTTFAGQAAELLGWGATEFTGPKSDVLLKTDVEVLSIPDCQNQTGAIPNQMCTFKAGHDSCQADSGGPVMWMDQNSYREYIIGIISFGTGCATSKPSLNTRVTSYLSWIASVTPDADYCVK